MKFASAPGDAWGVVGHEWVIESLEHAIRADRAAHAFLFTGPHGIGKTTLARAMARRLQCTGEKPPCGQCVACVKNARGISPDVRVIEGAISKADYDKTGVAPPRKSDREHRILLVDQLRHTVEQWLAVAPYESRHKIAILRRFEDANESASNAFLKTLEEPPKYAVLVLTAQDVSLVLPTIASRCQRVSLRPLPIALVERALIEKWNVDATQASLLARLSGGRMGWAVRASADTKILDARREALESLNALLKEERAERIARGSELAKDADELPQVFEFWMMWWRDLLLLQSGDGARVTNVDYEDALHDQAARFSMAEVESAMTANRAAARQLEQNANARLVTDVLALSLPKI